MRSNDRISVPRLVLIVLAALAVAATACGEEDGGDGSNSSTETETNADNEGEDSREGVVIEVTAADFSFSPAALNVPAGAEIEVLFENTGDAPHTMTAEDVGLDISADPGATEEGSFTAPASGIVEFACSIHPDMRGQIVVGDTAPGGGGDDQGGGDSYDY